MQKLPEDFVERMKAKLGNEYLAYVNCLTDNPSVCVRKNPFKPTSLFYREQQLTYCKDAFILSERPHFHHDPLLHAGCYYVQEAGSVFLEHIFHQLSLPEHPVVLDLCAAPGGKSTHLLSLIHQKGVLVSNEIITSRNKILQQNIYKWGCDNAIITQSGSEHFKECPDLFDLIVVDAPCSGEGLFRKDPDAVSHWSKSTVEGCSRRQLDITQSAIHALKPGGYLIYSTCTFEQSENDDVVKSLILNHGFRQIKLQAKDKGIVSTSFGLQFFPHLTRSEGFYISALQKVVDHNSLLSYSNQCHKYKSIQLPDQVKPFLKDAEMLTIENYKGEAWYVSPAVLNILTSLNHIPVKSAGIPLGRITEKYKPHPALALSNKLHYENQIDVSDREALLFLSGHTLANTENRKGLYLLTFKQCALGWVHAVDGRLNNLYPHEWRIQYR
ncbi:MAG: methyltransferase RsmF C-terminal domain-like protein [Bacteroidota bacterium]|jgi:16S rRNA C967 or C1407 C5-methylase (RsmB/RsmF family)/NOL1/NOP2/fmu family ribosome biogenesis protein